MKKSTITHLIYLPIALILFSSCNFNSTTEVFPRKGEFIPIDFEFIEQSAYDPTWLYEREWWKPNSPITLFEFIDTEDYLKRESDRNFFNAPKNVDFDTKMLIVAYGRPILEMESRSNEYSNGKVNYTLRPTFTENHEGNQVFFYIVDKKIFTPSYMSPCYVMNGDEKISYGDAKLFLNEADPEKIIGAL